MKITENNFITELINRNEKALEYVVSTYGWIIKSIVKKHLYNLESHQEECINDILLGIWNNISSFNESKSTFKNWVGAISKYKTIDYKRKYLRDLQTEGIDHIEITSESNSFNEVTNKVLNKELEELLNCLKPEDKDLFLKLYVEEQGIDSISKETGLKRDVIYNRLSRGRKKMKKKLNIIERRC